MKMDSELKTAALKPFNGWDEFHIADVFVVTHFK